MARRALFKQHKAATRLQAMWRGQSVRKEWRRESSLNEVRTPETPAVLESWILQLDDELLGRVLASSPTTLACRGNSAARSTTLPPFHHDQLDSKDLCRLRCACRRMRDCGAVEYAADAHVDRQILPQNGARFGAIAIVSCALHIYRYCSQAIV